MQALRHRVIIPSLPPVVTVRTHSRWLSARTRITCTRKEVLSVYEVITRIVVNWVKLKVKQCRWKLDKATVRCTSLVQFAAVYTAVNKAYLLSLVLTYQCMSITTIITTTIDETTLSPLPLAALKKRIVAPKDMNSQCHSSVSINIATTNINNTLLCQYPVAKWILDHRQRWVYFRSPLGSVISPRFVESFKHDQAALTHTITYRV